MKAYIVGDGDDVYTLVTADGKGWYSHWCSNRGFARGDLYFNRPERIEELNKEYGVVEVLYMGEDDMTDKKLRELNEKWWATQKC